VRLDWKLGVNLAVVALLAVVTVGWVVVQLVGVGVVEQPMTVTADFASSGGVFTNQEVTYRGVLVGKVGDLQLNDDGVDIELLVDPEWKGKIPADLTAKVQSKSAVGEQFVNLTPRSSSGEMLRDGDVIPRSNTRLSVDFQELLRSLDRVLQDVPPATTRRLIHNLAGGLGGRGDDIATVLESLGTLSRTFASLAPEQKRLLDNSTRAGAEFLRTKDAFAAAIRAADEVAAGIGDEPEELRALFAANDRLATEGLRLLSAQGGNLRGGIRALADFVGFQLDEREELEKSLEYLPQFLRAIEESSIPWRSPDGREFYRIRIGLVFDNVRSSWPCKYRLPFEYERFPFERSRRTPVTDLECR
jgi:phospholipid/cholesterol/gamma-HCH transport system substrate-binding protein